MTKTPATASASRFRFRAWDPKTKKMVEDTGVPHTGHRGSVDLTNHIYMQSTGLTDKNGKEIFEGDLFKCIYDFDGCTEHVMEVCWNTGVGGFCMRSHGKSCHQKGVTKRIWDFCRQEIIGNIYENPDLLTKAA